MKVFKSKIDLWLVVIIVGSIGVALFTTIQAVFMEPSNENYLALAITIVVGIGLPGWLFASTEYVVDNGELFISCGPVRKRIQLRDIKSATPSKNPLSSPALSLDRILITYGENKSILISPENKKGFLKAIGMSPQK
jgi:hypothetical protein